MKKSLFMMTETWGNQISDIIYDDFILHNLTSIFYLVEEAQQQKNPVQYLMNSLKDKLSTRIENTVSIRKSLIKCSFAAINWKKLANHLLENYIATGTLREP